MTEDIKNGYCNFEPGQGKCENLTCEKWRLNEVQTLVNEEAIGWHRIVKILKCSKCGKPWKVFEEYDSQHGFSCAALKLGETIKHRNIEQIFWRAGNRRSYLRQL